LTGLRLDINIHKWRFRRTRGAAAN